LRFSRVNSDIFTISSNAVCSVYFTLLGNQARRKHTPAVAVAPIVPSLVGSPELEPSDSKIVGLDNERRPAAMTSSISIVSISESTAPRAPVNHVNEIQSPDPAAVELGLSGSLTVSGGDTFESKSAAVTEPPQSLPPNAIADSSTLSVQPTEVTSTHPPSAQSLIIDASPDAAGARDDDETSATVAAVSTRACIHSHYMQSQFGTESALIILEQGVRSIDCSADPLSASQAPALAPPGSESWLTNGKHHCR